MRNLTDAELTWMRQPHYYMGLYSYTYSAGLGLATKIAKEIHSNDRIKNTWLKLLHSGGTYQPLAFCKELGYDISDPKFIDDVIAYIEQNISFLEAGLK